MHAMCDLETFGKRPGCAIRSIGAAMFDLSGNGWVETFYANIDKQSCLDAGLTIERETLDWWEKQPRETEDLLSADARPLKVVVETFNAWFRNNRGAQIWCQGAGFDAPIWQMACEAVNTRAPWNYYDVRDTRTVYEVSRFNQKSIPKVGVHHHALDDCKFQIIAVQTALRSIGVM